MASLLENLPNELLLESLSYFKPLIRDVHQPNGPGDAWDEFYKTMASVCLVSKHLARIATPVLYSGIVFRQLNAGSNHSQRLKFIRTLAQDHLLGQHIHYLDDRWILDYNGTNTLEKDILNVDAHLSTSYQIMLRKWALSIWETRLFACWRWFLGQVPQQAITTLLLMHTPNIRDLNVSISSNSSADFARLLGWERDDNSSQPRSCHGFRQLQTLHINDMQYRGIGGDLNNARFHQCLSSLSALKHYSFSYMRTLPENPNLTGCLANVQTLHLPNGPVPLRGVAQIVRSCSQLRVFSFAPRCSGGFISFATLHLALRCVKETLEHIELSVSQRFATRTKYSPLGSFKEFHNLKILRVPDIVLMGQPPNIDYLALAAWTDHRPRHRIVDRLPQGLELFILASEMIRLSDDTDMLWDFLHDAHQVPNLRTVGFNGRMVGDTRKLTAAFKVAGITSRETMPEHDRLRLLDDSWAVRDRSCSA